MFPMEFDYRILNTLPLPSEETTKNIQRILRAILVRRVLPYFKNHKGTDNLKLSQVGDHVSIVRLEDEGNRIRIVSAVTRSGESDWRIQIHERIFDYLAFVIPSDHETRMGEGTIEEHKMLAFTEFFLRHGLEHILYPERKEREMIVSDVDFAFYRRRSDPTFYRVLRSSLADEMNGIQGKDYLALLDAAEQGLPYDTILGTILNGLVTAAADVPGAFLHEVFTSLDAELKTGILGEYCRRSRSTTYSLLERATSFQKVLRLFDILIGKNEKEALEVFYAFKDRWGLVGLFHELSLPEQSLDNRAPEELFRLFKSALHAYSEEDRAFESPARPALAIAPTQPKERTEKSLKDRIEEARSNPDVPRRVLEVIDKNKLNAVGQSGSKYNELIETLLSIPWGKIQKIKVSPQAFEEGLNRSHYGLQKPKEIVCDFFTNLIWRYQRFTDAQAASWRQTGSAFLFVGPPGVGKTSLAISIAQNLGIPYHKLSLGGMRDETDIRGHGFTYEGSKPGSILQGLIKMEALNGLFILDEADKTEKFAIATLLEILDPEQNHLFHDKYIETTVDIDLSNCHFFLTANSLDSVPPVVVNRCEVVVLDRYSVEEKKAIAQQYLIRRLRKKYQIEEDQIYFDPKREADLLGYLIRNYTYEPGVRELERIIRTLFLRLQRKEILTNGELSVRITREMIKKYLKEPSPPRQIGEEDVVGEMLGLGVNLEQGLGAIIPIQATRIEMQYASTGNGRASISIIHATGNIEKVMDESRKVATTGIFHCAEELEIDLKNVEDPIHLHFMGGSTKKDGPSAGGAISLALASLLSDKKVRRDVAMSGEMDTRGRITGVGGLAVKIETASNAGCRTVIIPRENLLGEDGIERFPEALKNELQILTFEEWNSPDHQPFDYTKHMLQVVAVDKITQAAKIAFVDEGELARIEASFEPHALRTAALLKETRSRQPQCLLILQVKTPEELDPDFFRQLPVRESFGDVVLLIPPEIRARVLARLGDQDSRVRLRDFSPKQESLSAFSREVLTSYSSSHATGPPVHLSVIAPYFFLKRDGIGPDDFPAGPQFEGLSLFANNFTFQEVKIKDCKTVLDQVYSLLSLLDPSGLATCPFLGKRNGIYTIDLSFIPEKYRLDVHRAGAILKRSLGRWLAEVCK